VVHLLVLGLLINRHRAVVVHVDLVVLLLLQHHQLGLLFLIEHVNATIVSGRWDTSGKVSELVQLVEVLCTL
jgi:glycerol-3-phosphate responsive antiterminator